MDKELDERIESILIEIMSDGFNRSINVLEEVGAINRKKMLKEYKGIGSKYYDLVAEQFEYTAHYGKKAIYELLQKERDKLKSET